MKRLVLIAALAALGCSRKEQVAGVVVEILTDLRVPEELDAVELRVDVAGADGVVKQSFPVDPGAAGAKELPLYYGLYPKQGKGGQFTVTAAGSVKGKEVVWRSAKLAFPTVGPTVLLQLPLLSSCVGQPCDPLTTCVGAFICRPHDVFVEQLTPYRKGGGDPIMGGESDGGMDASRPRDTAPPAVEAGVDVPPAPPPDVRPPDDVVSDLRPDLAPDTGPPPDVGPNCTPQPESCFNNADEDCDGLIDCADPDCVPASAHCVPFDPTDNPTPGVTAAATCPAGFNQSAPITVRSGPTGAACTGCSCGPAAATCDNASVVTYTTAAECQGDIAPKATTPPTFTRADGCKVPQYMGGFLGGIKVAPMTPTLAACTASGTPSPGAVTWASTTRFCATTLRGGGCPQGRVCVPKAPGLVPPPPCLMYTGLRACPAGTTKLQNADWYTGSSDGRSCSACTCAGPTGGSCAGVTIHIGNDYTCSPNNGDLAPGTKMCYPSTIYVPGLRIDGNGTAGSCAPRTTTSGTITPTGPRTICCQ